MFYQKIPGLIIENSNGLPRIEQTPEGTAMRAIPGWAVYLDPAYMTGGRLRNRARSDGADYGNMITGWELTVDH